MPNGGPEHEPVVVSQHWWALVPVVGGIVSSLIGWLRQRSEKPQEPATDERGRLSRLEDGQRDMTRALADIRREQADDRRMAAEQHAELYALIRGALSPKEPS